MLYTVGVGLPNVIALALRQSMSAGNPRLFMGRPVGKPTSRPTHGSDSLIKTSTCRFTRRSNSSPYFFSLKI
jgi:hypothetical protein